MPIAFNADEVLALAGEIERVGDRFYARAAALVADAGLRELLTKLSRWEAEHQRTFAALRARLGQEPEALLDLDDATGQYLRALASGAVFPTEDEDGRWLGTPRTAAEILERALRVERDSIAYYTGLRAAMPAAWGPAAVDDIVKEEMGHVILLSAELRRVKG
jgi:rubrerythrin